MSAEKFADLVVALREFRASRPETEPSDRHLAKLAGVSPTTIGNWLSGATLPKHEDVILKLVRAIAATTTGDRRAVAGELLDEGRWRDAYRAENRRLARTVSEGARRGQATRVLAEVAAGRPLAEVTDPFALEVHRPVVPEDAEARRGLPALPAYVPRAHDAKLAEAARAAGEGHSGIVVLVGGSSTGKTRACWEALDAFRALGSEWRLWHPIDPSHPEEVFEGLRERSSS